MDLAKTKRNNAIVKLKGNPFTIGHTSFNADTKYRSIILSNGKHKEILVYGEIFSGKEFEDLFEIIL